MDKAVSVGVGTAAGAGLGIVIVAGITKGMETGAGIGAFLGGPGALSSVH